MSSMSVSHARKRVFHRSVSGLGVGALVGASLVLGAAPAAAAITSADAPTIAAALAGPGAAVTGASFVTVPGATANGVGDSALTSFPRNGATFAIMSTGAASSADDANTNAPPESTGTGDDKTTNFGGGNRRGNTDFDVSVLKVDLQVAPSANCLSFDFQFLTEEYNDWVGGQFNDAFIAELDSSTWTTAGSAITAPNNFAFAPSGSVVSVNAVGIGGFSRTNAGNTTYDGATPALSAAKPVTPGAHSLYLSIFDQGDGILDSAAFVDNLRVGFVPDPATQCKPGAVVKNFQLDLTPATATRDAGSTHTVTATLQDLNATPPALAGGTILFQVSGANPTSGSAVTDASGQATFTYPGTTVGADTISACYDTNDNGVCDSTEVFASAQATWVNPPPTNDAGGPYSGNEGSAIALTGSANDPNGDSLTHQWSYTPGAGVDPGATCTISDPTALSTNLICTDDGAYTVALATSDGTNDDVTDTATVTVNNVAPSIGTVTTPLNPVPVNTSVALTGTFTDPGSNDTHTASVDWGDTSSSSPSATAGTVSDSHTYTAAGIYTVCLTVTDDDAGEDTQCAPNYVVVYDPSAGFVTGGGWVNVPAGSAPAIPSADGPARFGFVSKYQKGAGVPQGSTEFQFQAGELNFHSTSYEWLVIAGAKAVYKGTGTVNGDSGYKFLLSAVDGNKTGGGGADKLRIKIWDASSGAVVFDNQSGAGDDATATTAISKGSIVIHS